MASHRSGSCIFFFQAEDGIRDWSVTGVQTCALPIFGRYVDGKSPKYFKGPLPPTVGDLAFKIGRASCRERVEISVGAGAVKKEGQRVTKVAERVGGQLPERQKQREQRGESGRRDADQ